MTDADDTPTRLVIAAERLFAEAGAEATSLRAIARLALSNSAAVHYHFGGRDELHAAVLDRQLAPVAVRRAELLDKALQAPVVVAAVLEACLRPDLEHLAKLRKRRVGVARFVGRSLSHPDGPVAALVAGWFDALVRQVVPVLHGLSSDVDSAELRARLWLVRLSVAGLYATASAPGGPAPLGTEDVNEQVRRLMAFYGAGLLAPGAQAGSPRDGKRRKRQEP